jgi:hypothetical protein
MSGLRGRTVGWRTACHHSPLAKFDGAHRGFGIRRIAIADSYTARTVRRSRPAGRETEREAALFRKDKDTTQADGNTTMPLIDRIEAEVWNKDFRAVLRSSGDQLSR